MTYLECRVPIHLNQSMSIYEEVLGVFQLESCEDFRAIISRSFAKILTKYVMSIDHFAPYSCTCKLYISPSCELRNGNDTSGGSNFFVKVCSENKFDSSLIERPPRVCGILHVKLLHSRTRAQCSSLVNHCDQGGRSYNHHRA